MRLMAQANSLLISHCDGERLARGDRHERDLRVLQETGLGATRHRLELDLAMTY